MSDFKIYTYKNKILDKNNKSIILKGVSKSGLEYSYVALETMIPDMIDFDINNMLEWGFNSVRIPLRDIYWLNNIEYRDVIYYWIDKLTSNKIIVILDLHTQQLNQNLDKFILKNSSGNDGKSMWIDIANKFNNNTYIFFELFNEPHNIDVNIWWNGSNEYYGYKEILKEIRSRADNICIIGGLDWAYQWSFLNKYPDIIDDLLKFKNIVLATHPYGYRGGPKNNGIETEHIPTIIEHPNNYEGDCHLGITIPTIPYDEYGWNESFGFIMEKEMFPLIATEWGLDRPDNCIQGGWYNVEILKYMNSINMSNIAWAWVQDRLDYPSLLDKEFQPTGECIKETRGPPCSGILNNYYRGPGKLVIDDLKKFNKQSRYMLCNYHNIENINYDYNLIIILFFVIIFFIIVFILYFIKTYIYTFVVGKLKKKENVIDNPIIKNNSNIYIHSSIRIRSSSSLAQITPILKKL